MDVSDVALTTEAVHTERLLLRPYRPEDVDPVCSAPAGTTTWRAG